MGLTRFRDRVSGVDGPVSGALYSFYVPIAVIGAATQTAVVSLPAGMGFEITDALFTASGISATPDMTIGDTAAGTQVVASVACTTDLGALTIKDGTIVAGGFISVVVVATASDTVTEGNLSIHGFLTAPPTSVMARGYTP